MDGEYFVLIVYHIQYFVFGPIQPLWTCKVPQNFMLELGTGPPTRNTSLCVEIIIYFANGPCN